MKKLISVLFILSLLPIISSLNLEVEKLSSNEVLIPNLDKPVIFDLKIKNIGESDEIEFYNLVGFKMFPIGITKIDAGETKKIKLELYPLKEIKERGYYNINYFIKGKSSEIEEKLTFKIIDLKDSFEIGSEEIEPESSSIIIYIENKENFNFGKINVNFISQFFNLEEEFELGPNEKKEFTVQLNKEDFKKLSAGFYTLNAEIEVNKEKVDVEGSIRFIEENILKTTKKDYGFFISTYIIKKVNEGNIKTESETIIKKNIFSRLFTTFSPEPDITERENFYIYYNWNDEISPGEYIEITVKTNWLFPLLIIILIILIIIFIKNYTKDNLRLKKKVTFVRAKGGEFALKVSVFIHAKKHVERVSIIERLPALVKIHERFGGEAPSRVDEKNRRIEWNFDKLEAGETRMISYLIYSKIGVLGRFALPSATAVYEKDGEIQETESNRAFFVAEQKADKSED
jgi:hypothetical protein